MTDPLIKLIKAEQDIVQEKLTQLKNLQNQTEVFTLHLLWDRLFNPVYRSIKEVQKIPNSNWDITDFTFEKGGEVYFSITLTLIPEPSNQFVFDTFLAEIADESTQLDINNLRHVKVYMLAKFNMVFAIQLPIPATHLSTLRDLGKIHTTTTTEESILCSIDYSAPF